MADQRLLYYFEQQSGAPLAKGVALWERAVAELGERKEPWFELGDELFHWGERLSIPDAAQRSALALDRALALDSVFAPALEHRVALAMRLGDTAIVRRLGDRYIKLYPAEEASDYLRWSQAVTSGDSTRMTAERARFSQYSDGTLYHVVHSAQQLVVRPRDADEAVAVLQRRANAPGKPPIPESAFGLFILRRGLHLNRGQPRAAQQITDDLFQETATLPTNDGRGNIYQALYWDGDTIAASRAAQRAAQRVLTPARNKDEQSRYYVDLCALEHWKLAHGDSRTVQRSIAKLRDRQTPLPAGWSGDADDNVLCAATLDVLASTMTGKPDSAAVARLDSIQTRGVWPYFVYHSAGTIALARAYEASGDVARALEVIRRREYGVGVPTFFSTMLREEGRLAALNGDRAGAIKAYRHYLALRADPDPELAGDAARVRVALQKLERPAGK